MEKSIAYCGINCTECQAYLATQKNDIEEIKEVAKDWSSESMSFKPEDIYCDSCKQNDRIFSWCKDCTIKSCCIGKGFENCAYCEDYFCNNLKMTFDRTPSAKERLDQIWKYL
ncbi:MAG: DUF3795 domain-containing protein [Promethearchaeota archaeon]